MTDQSALPAEPRYGWVMVAMAPLYLGFGIGSLGAISVFLKPLSAEFGWLRGETTFAYMAGMAAIGAGGLLMGHLADRYTTRRIVLLGTVVMGCGFLLMARQSALWEFIVLSMFSMGVGGAALFTPLLANLGGWFNRNKGLAMGIATAGQSLGQGLVPYVASLLIAAFGWRMAYNSMGIAVLAVLFPLALLIRNPPLRAEPQAGDSAPGLSQGDISSYAQPRTTLSLVSLAAVFCCITMATPLVHVVALASDRGLPAESAARVLLIMMLSGFFGRIFFGRLTDRIGPLRTYMIASTWQSVLVYWFVEMESPLGFYALAAVFGFGYSGVMTCLILCAQNFSRAGQMGFATALVALFGFVGMGLGGIQAGIFFDLYGDYTVSFLNATMAGGVNLMILSFLEGYIHKRQTHHAVSVTPV
jgi:MFS family permease